MSVWSRVQSRRVAAIVFGVMCCLSAGAKASAEDRMYFAALDNIRDVLVQKINAETVRVDISAWYLTEHSISIALINKYRSGVPVRLLGDRGSIFEIDPLTRKEYYWLANQGLPIRLRVNPTWYPEIHHWKATIFVGQNQAMFGSANYTPFELAPAAANNYKDETVLLTEDASIVNALKTKFDKYWNDTLAEPESKVPSAPYFKDWNDACVSEHLGCDYFTLNPNPAPMVINRARLEPDYPLPPDLVWGQGSAFNNRLVKEINAETKEINFVIYRLTVNNITDALLAKFRAGVPVKLLIEPNEYLNRKWPEFWLTHANLDKLWAAGVPIKKRIHNGLTHMKTLVTSKYATNASSNYAAAWQRDVDYFISATDKPAIYQAVKDRVTTMWNDSVAFAPFVPQPPDKPILATPASDATGVATTVSLVWNITPFAVSYDIYLGTSQANMTLVGNVPAQLVNSPPTTYSWKPETPLQTGTRYLWKVVARTNATPVNPSIVNASLIWAFTTAGAAGPPAAPINPTPSNGATGIGTSPTLGWSAGAAGTTFNVAFGTSNPPAQVAATGLTSPSYAPGTLLPGTTYFWRVTAVSGGGSTAGSVWSFTTASGGADPATDIVLYASDATTHGTWTTASDPTAAGGMKLTHPDNEVAALAAPLANPANYVDASFQAQAGVRYRVWLRIHAIADSKFNDSLFVQYSDSVNASGSPVYRIGTSGGYTVNLWTCATCQSLGWGWQRNAYWLSDTGDVWFQNTGSHTIRVQVREDGAEVDQIVLSPVTYATSAPGAATNDTTIVPKPGAPTLPAAPGSPSPNAGATGVSPNPTLTWSASGATSYDVRFGTSNPPPLVVSGASSASYTPPGLANGAVYFWQVIARNAAGATTGAVWNFTTAVAAPATPDVPSPADGATDLPTTVTLTWSAPGATSYDVLIGPEDPPSQVASNISSASYTVSGLSAGATYFWQIVAHNSGGDNQGPVWTFTTQAETSPTPPGAPSSPSPAAGASAVSTSASLTWSASNATSYDVRFGTANPPPQVVIGQTAASFAPALAASTTYFWQIVANNAAGSTAGPIWSFTTVAPPPPPGEPSSANPGDGATGVATNAALSWSASGATAYDVRFGTTNPPPQVATDQTGTSYSPALANDTTYFWQIVAKNAGGLTAGPIWSFRTVAPIQTHPEVVLYAGDIPAANLHGAWSHAADATAAGGVTLTTPDNGFASANTPLASPAHYVDVSFTADAGTSYTVWLRLKALNNNKLNDAVWVQFSDALVSGSPVYRLGTTSGLLVNLATDSTAVSLNNWGWQNGAYWLSQAVTVRFATTGSHTMRIQVREDGAQLDQIVLSSAQYLTSAPGGPTNDPTIVPKP